MRTEKPRSVTCVKQQLKEQREKRNDKRQMREQTETTKRRSEKKKKRRKTEEEQNKERRGTRREREERDKVKTYWIVHTTLTTQKRKCMNAYTERKNTENIVWWTNLHDRRNVVWVFGHFYICILNIYIYIYICIFWILYVYMYVLRNVYMLKLWIFKMEKRGKVPENRDASGDGTETESVLCWGWCCRPQIHYTTNIRNSFDELTWQSSKRE